jgi:polyhydroxyalkanoate synthesis regulator phasin
MRRTRIAALTAAGALAVAGTGVAVATTSSDDPKEREQAVLADAAKRLNVTPSELRDALSDAEDAQLDADVKAGRLTQEQADALKKRRAEMGTVLGPGKHMGPHLSFRVGPHDGGPIELFDTAAKALGISAAELKERLADGKSLDEIAKAEGKTADDVRDAVRSTLEERFDKAVEDGDLTREQADRMLSHTDEMLEHLGDLRLPKPGFPPFGFGHSGGGPIELMDTAADALGISPAQLKQRLADGKSLEEIAEAQGKSLDNVREAVEAKLKERFDKAVENGDLTREQADEMLSRTAEMLEDLGDFRFAKPGFPGPPPDELPAP